MYKEKQLKIKKDKINIRFLLSISFVSPPTSLGTNINETQLETNTLERLRT